MAICCTLGQGLLSTIALVLSVCAGSAADASGSTVGTLSAEPYTEFPAVTSLHCCRAPTHSAGTAADEREGLRFFIQLTLQTGLACILAVAKKVAVVSHLAI